MALKKCGECGKDVSKKADTCPNCGNPIKKKGGSSWAPSSGVILIAVLGFAFYFTPDTNPTTTPTPAPSPVNPEVARWESITRFSRVDCRLWSKENSRYPGKMEITDVKTARLEGDRPVTAVYVDGESMNGLGLMIPFRATCLYSVAEDDSLTRFKTDIK